MLFHLNDFVLTKSNEVKPLYIKEAI
jgi:hypothetical protein